MTAPTSRPTRSRRTSIGVTNLPRQQAQTLCSLLYSNIAKTEVVDDYTARITLKTPFSAFTINNLAHPSGVMISPAALKQYGNKDIAFHPVGTGPFKFVEWKATDYLKVAKFDGYWRKGYPKIDTITWKPVIDSNTRAAVNADRRSAVHLLRCPTRWPRRSRRGPRLDIRWPRRRSSSRYLSMNTRAAVKPFDNPKVRQAINATRSTRTPMLVKVAFGGYATAADAIVPEARRMLSGENRRVAMYDVAKAKQLMAEAGYRNGFRNRACGRRTTTPLRRRSRRCCSSNCSRSASRPK